jgi:hypothetical protein
MKYDVIVLGTGLSSYASMLVLSKTKLRILVLDYGIKSNVDLSQTKIDNLKKYHDINKKTFFSDDFSTKGIKEDSVKNFDFNNSYAYGGHSNIWGCSIEKKFTLNNLNIRKKALEDAYELLDRNIAQIKSFDYMSNNTLKLFKSLKTKNKTAEFRFEESSLAINKSTCIKCNECLYGCRYKATFSTVNFFNAQNKKKNITYLNNQFVNTIEENKKNITVKTLSGGNEFSFECKKLFIGLGAINTAKLLLRSFSFLKKISVKDSQYFIFPAIDLRFYGRFNKSQGVALTQFSIKQLHKKDSIFYQVYAPSIYIQNQIKLQIKNWKYLGKFLGFFSNFITNRLYLFSGYLPSKWSTTIVLQKKNSKIFSRIIKKTKSDLIQHSVNNLSRVLLNAGLWGLKKQTRINKPFSGYHFGSSLPMANNIKSKNETDLLGRPFRLKNVYIIDASVLPEISAGPNSYLMMANAIRITALATKVGSVKH